MRWALDKRQSRDTTGGLRSRGTRLCCAPIVRRNTPDFAGWTVLDFKTDREFAILSDRYTAQVSAYSEAVGTATGLPSRGILMVV
jgi:hypothetical protein